MSEFIARALPNVAPTEARPEVGRLDYDLWTLRITLHFGDAPPCYLTFRDLSGFRVLREGDLLEYWGPGRPEGWLWEVEAGGWRDSESQRSGFVSGDTKGIREFLVAGDVDCISVLSSSLPELTRMEP